MNIFTKIKLKICNILTRRCNGSLDEDEFVDPSSAVDFKNGLFLNSLDDFSEADITLNERAASAGKLRIARIVRGLLIIVFLAVFVISGVLLLQNLISKQRGSEIYNELEEQFFSGGFSVGTLDGFDEYRADDEPGEKDTEMLPVQNPEDASEEADSTDVIEEQDEELEKIRAALTSLYEINPDIYGWISVEGTDINYPIVQGADNVYYLNHAYTGEFLPMGAIFADYRCDSDVMNNGNTVLYGHNVENMIGRSMFHDIVKFFRDEYFFEVCIYIYTFDGIYVYEPFAIYETRHDYMYFKTSFESDEEFVNFANEVHSNSAKVKEMSFTENDRLLTLSTCTNGPFYARYALHAKLVCVIE